jgi:diphthamide biosynthesis methyltransferase
VLIDLCRATTHTDLELRARDLGIPVKIIHNASIMNAVGVCGLQLYRFGEVGLPHTRTLAAHCPERCHLALAVLGPRGA